MMGLYWMLVCVVLLLCLTEAQPSSASETVKNFYDTLDVEPTATGSQIKKSFRRLAVKYHPDKNKSAHAETTFREIAEAYSVLSDKKKRRLYDSVGHKAYLESQASLDPDGEPETSFHFSFSEFFHDFHDNLFEDEPHFHWNFLREEEDKYYSEGPDFSFYFEDTYENEDEHYYYYY